ncbi:unnamed protein product [Caenorhabditis angaria]|uniref:Ig-like domain-containing protein n=1 Tax=Caenorhabditis angaria TaxID=860376 RepID=A0A9P1N9D8_9PELO|nr:unnamed protein product [Caenorhabditis angaria]
MLYSLIFFGLLVQRNVQAQNEIGNDVDELQVIINPNTTTIQKPAGDQVSIVCTVRGYNKDKPGVLWKTHGGLDRTGNVEIKKLDEYTLALVIRNSTIEDSGVYTCRAQIGDKIVTNSVDIVIFEDLVFAEKQLNYGEVLATTSVNVSCEVTAKQSNVVTYWTRHEKKIRLGDKFQTYKGGALLEIRNYQPDEDAGQYTCEVFHVPSGASTSRTITLGTISENNLVACQLMCNAFCAEAQNQFKPFAK